MHFIVLLYLWTAPHTSIHQVGAYCFVKQATAEAFADEWTKRGIKLHQGRESCMIDLDEQPLFKGQCLPCDQDVEDR